MALCNQMCCVLAVVCRTKKQKGEVALHLYKCPSENAKGGVALRKRSASSKGQSSHVGFAYNKKHKWGLTKSKISTRESKCITLQEQQRGGGGASLTKSMLSLKGPTFRSNNRTRHLHKCIYKKGFTHSNELHSHTRLFLLENS